MAIVKRFFLLICINLLVITTISTLLHLLGIGSYLTAYGIDYPSLMAFCLMWGMGGSFISLGLSRLMARWMLGVEIIDPQTRDATLQNLVQTVYHLARSAHLSVMPQVGIYPSPEINAFATGPTRSRSLVAVSSGLLTKMKPHEVRGVLGHEIAHIANGDMVTMTLLQGVVNAFAMFLSRILSFFILQALRGDREDRNQRSTHGGYLGYFISTALEMFFLMLGSIVVYAFSRYREFRADAGGASLAGREAMLSALNALKRFQETVPMDAASATVQTLKITNRPSRFFALFSSHPPLEERISRLQRQ